MTEGYKCQKLSEELGVKGFLMARVTCPSVGGPSIDGHSDIYFF